MENGERIRGVRSEWKAFVYEEYREKKLSVLHSPLSVCWWSWWELHPCPVMQMPGFLRTQVFFSGPKSRATTMPWRKPEMAYRRLARSYLETARKFRGQPHEYDTGDALWGIKHSDGSRV